MKIGMYEAFRRSRSLSAFPRSRKAPTCTVKNPSVGSTFPSTSSRTRTTPGPIDSISRAAACERSMMRLSTNGPRSVMRTIVDLLLLRFVTRTMVSNGNVRCAAVSLFIS